MKQLSEVFQGRKQSKTYWYEWLNELKKGICLAGTNKVLTKSKSLKNS